MPSTLDMNLAYLLRFADLPAQEASLAPLRSLGWALHPIQSVRQAIDPIGLPEPSAVLCEWTDAEDPELETLCRQRPTVLVARLPNASAMTRAAMVGAMALIDLRADPMTWAASLPLWVIHHGERRGMAAREQEHRTAIADARTISAAVGMLAASEGVTIDQAFAKLRNAARSQRRRLERTAADVLEAHRQTVVRD